MVKRINAGKRERKVNEYVCVRGMTEEDAENKVETKFLDVNKKTFIVLLKYLTNLQHGTLHKKIVDKVNEYTHQGFDLDKAVRMP
jgi:hypothetical protein